MDWFAGIPTRDGSSIATFHVGTTPTAWPMRKGHRVNNGYIYDYTGSLLQVDEGESSREVGKKRYELKNHLGNVLSVVTDKKFADEVEYIPSIVDQAGISVTGDEIKRTATGSGWGVSGGASGEWIYGDGYVLRRLGGTAPDNVNIMVGLSYGNTDAHFNTIDYALYSASGSLIKVYEGGTKKLDGPSWSVGDILKVERRGGTINYYQNSTLLRSVSEDPADAGEPLLVDFAMNNESTTIYKLRIGNTGYVANVTSAQDYYPFGSIMPGRNYNAGDHRFGFNGMEKDDEVKGSGNSLNFGARIYDPRVGRWLSTDPLFKNYPNVSPYNYALNSPIIFLDPDGNRVVAANEESREAVLNYLHEQFGEGVYSELTDNFSIIIIASEEAGSGTFHSDNLETAAELETGVLLEDKQTKASESSLFLHELLDHFLSETVEGESEDRDQRDQVKYHNKALKNVPGSNGRTRSGDDH